MTTKQQVDDFLALKRIAVVGVSRDPKGFGTVLWQEFRQRRYEAIPVNPAVTRDRRAAVLREGSRTSSRGVEGALIMTSKKATDQIVHDCAEAGIKHVWMYGGMAPGAATKSAVAFCEEKGISVVQGLCPYMFLPGTPCIPRPPPGLEEADRQLPEVGPLAGVAGSGAVHAAAVDRGAVPASGVAAC